MSKLKRNIVCVALFLVAAVLSLFGVLVFDEPISASAAGTPVQTVEGTQTYQLFNSGNSGAPKWHQSVGNPDTFDNGGYEIWVVYQGSYPTRRLGLSFQVNYAINEKAILTINAYDVNEAEGERAILYLCDETNGDRLKIPGYLHGMEQQWNTTVLEIAPSYFTVGHRYHIEVTETVAQWGALIRTVSLQINGQGGQVTEPVITESDFTASIDSNGLVTTSLYLKTSKTTTFTLEYAANRNYNQYGSAHSSATVTSAGITKTQTFRLQSAPVGTYEIDVIIKDGNGNNVTTLSVTAGYQYYSVNYNANGGSNNLPFDSTAYASGGNVTVLFDYVPSKSGYTFAGWSTNRSATEPMYTANGTKNFNIYSDTTLYAVWKSAQHVHTEGEWIVGRESTCAQGGYKYTVCTGCGVELNRVTIPALPHTDGEWVTQSNPSCTTSGVKALKCAICDEYIRYSYLPAFGHDYVSEVISEATCTQDGCIQYTCNTCQHSYTVTVNAEHNYVLTVQEATCTEDGAMVYTCSKCGDIYTTVIPASHSYVAEVVRLATRDEDGLIRYTCEVCGHYYEEVVPASDANVLLIQDRVPWSVDNVPKLLNKLVADGYIAGWSATTTSQFNQVNLAQYSVVYIANDQTTATYNQMAQLTDALTSFAEAGGVVVYGACDNGWAGGEIRYTLPGGVEKIENISRYNYILDGSHPIVTGSLTDDKALTNALLNGTYCSHTSFRESTLPTGYNVILQDGYGNPTLAEYPMGDGKIIVSGLTWEFYYSRIYQGSTSYSKNVFDDLIVYAASLGDYVACNHAYDDGVTVEATCTTEGYTLHTCTLCNGEMKDNFVAALGHDMGAWTVEREATCEVSGLKSQTCNRCQERVEEIIPAGEHDWTLTQEIIEDCLANFVAVYECEHCEEELRLEKPAKGVHTYTATIVEPTCIDQGYTLYSCTVCGGTMQADVVPALGHDMSDWVVEASATCVEDGLQSKTCNRCQFREEEVIPKLDHNLVLVEGVIEDCTQADTKTYRCDNCLQEEVVEIPANGEHSYVLISWQISTCTQEGYKQFECENCLCGHTEIIEKIPHTVYTWIIVNNATCTEEGLRQGECDVCGNTVNEAIPQLEHVYELMEQTANNCEDGYDKIYKCRLCNGTYSEHFDGIGSHTFREVGRSVATCEGNGEIFYKCRDCAMNYSVIYEYAFGHSYQLTNTVNANCTNDGYHEYVCHCGDSYRTEILAHGHNYVMTEDVAATCTTDGYTRYACTYCNAWYDNTRYQYGHNMDNGVCVQTSTCYEDAIYVFTCEHGCGYSYEMNVTEDHSAYRVAGEAVEATCTESGLTAGVYCDKCEAWYEAQESVPALGHDVTTVGGFPATCNKSGLTDGEYCNRCDTWMQEREEIPGGHIESDWTPVYEDGKLVKEVKTCQRCGMELDVRIPFVDDEGEGDPNTPNQPGLDVDINDNEVNVGTLNVGCSGVIGMAGILPCAAAIGSMLLIRRRKNNLEE